MKIFNLIVKKLNAEPFPWVLYLLLNVFISKLRSQIYAKVLNAPGLYMGSRSTIRGYRRIKIGNNVFFNDGVWIEALEQYGEQTFSPRIEIGNSVSFSKNVHLGCIDQILIGNGVLFGSQIYVSDHNHGCYVGEHQSHPDEAPAIRALSSSGAVIIEENVWVGDNVTILGPSTIGRGAIIAANSVVKGDVPSFSMVAGSPAKVVKKYDFSKKIWLK